MTKSLRGLYAVEVFLLLGSACTNADECGVTGSPRSDSGGITLVKNCIDDLTRSWQVDTLAPLVIFGGTPTALSTIVSIVQLADGRFLVADHSENRLHSFAPDGAFLKQMGREGRGPGEFLSSPMLTRSSGDSVLAVDLRARRLTLFTPDLKLARTASLLLDPEIGVPWPVGRGRHGRLVVRTDLKRAPTLRAGVLRSTIGLSEIDPDGRADHPIVELPGVEVLPHTPGPNRGGVRPIFGKNTALVSDSQSIFVALNDAFEIREFDYEGQLRGVVRLDIPRRRITNSIKGAMRARMSDLIRSSPVAGPSKDVEERLLTRPFAKFLPWIQSLFLSREGALWAVTVGSPEKGTQRLYRFERSGELSLSLELPQSWTPVASWNDSLLTIYRDSDRVEQIQVLRIVLVGGTDPLK